jgi:NADP-dependent 3-hydroxy acid dehydrogenase YdfG
MNLDRTLVIIGASAGMGEELARELNRQGWRLELIARRVDRLRALAKKFGLGTVIGRADVARADAAEMLNT